MKTRICDTCKTEKNIQEFYKNPAYKGGYLNLCKMCVRNYNKNWRKKNKLKNRQYQKKYYHKNVKNIQKAHKKYYELNPWRKSFQNARDRCNNPNDEHYKYYGGRGIKCLMLANDFKFLWFRDKAYNMEYPSIDRKDNDGNYTLENCRFIEFSENVRKARRRRSNNVFE